MLPLELASPWLNAAGSLGFAPDPRGPLLLGELGAFVTNPISLRPRKAAAPPRVGQAPGGVVLHTGHPNPGLSQTLRHYGGLWEKASLAIIPHLLAEQPEDLKRIAPRIEEVDNMGALEIAIPPDAAPELARGLLQAAQGELPLIAYITLARALELAPLLMEAGASAISLGPPRADTEAGWNGRLYGPAALEVTLAVTRQLVAKQIPVIAAGGIFRKRDGEDLLEAGALAVQVDVALWKGDWFA